MHEQVPVHVPVMLDRCVQLLEPALLRPDAVLVDATVGLGGHAHALLSRLPKLRVIGLDRDPAALRSAARRLQPFAGRVTLMHAVFDELGEVLDRLGHPQVCGLLFDLGVSSMQLDEADRGFAYARATPLDMRMDNTSGRTAAQVLNTYSQAELTSVLRRYGQERFAPAIARAVVRRREQVPLHSSDELVELVRSAIPAPARRTGGNPAKRTFQALRIEVNDELGALERVLPQIVSRLAPGGRVVLLSYHSGEDTAVKRALRQASTSTAPPGLPVELAEHAPPLRLLVRGAEQADAGQVQANPRAQSVRLRAAERVSGTGQDRHAGTGCGHCTTTHDTMSATTTRSDD